jgi:hypothetical protein
MFLPASTDIDPENAIWVRFGSYFDIMYLNSVGIYRYSQKWGQRTGKHFFSREKVGWPTTFSSTPAIPPALAGMRWDERECSNIRGTYLKFAPGSEKLFFDPQKYF